MKEEMDKTVYYITLDLFFKSNEINPDDVESKKLFPSNWYFINDYHLKTEILTEAIEKKIPITETEQYKKINLH